MMRETTFLIVGLVAVLATASLVSAMLTRRATDPSSATLVNLNQRINAWWVMVALIAVAFFFGKDGMTVLFALDLLRRAAGICHADPYAPQ